MGIGLAVCEDFWHPSVPLLLALDGAQILIDVSSSPGRDLASTNEVGSRDRDVVARRSCAPTPSSRRASWCSVNRVGNEESISFWGGSEVIAPSGRPLFSAPLYDEGLFVVDVDLADIRRERIGLPLLRDERPRARCPGAASGSSPSGPASPHGTGIAADDIEPGLDVAPIPAIDGSLR